MNWIKSHFDNVKEHPKKLATYVSTAFFLFFSWATLSFHDKLPLDDWRHHLRADAAGYYVYLPGTFHFGMKASNVDTSLVESAGKGFSLNREQDIIYTKYTYGTALLMTPFYLVAELIEGYGKTDGWTKTHHQLIEISGIFYLSAGIWLLSSILLGHYRVHQFIVILSIMVAVFGTNLFYYGFRAPAYSHVYSFFLVSSALFCIYPDKPDLSFSRRMILLITTALMIVIRPVDIVAVAAIFALLLLRCKNEFQKPNIFIGFPIAVFIVLMPQMIYWKLVSGDWIFYSYGNEGFTNWASPKMFNVLFAPGNGLLPNSPAFLLLPFGLAAICSKRTAEAVIILFAITIAIYICASWHVWHFGCSYGQRSLVQYVPFLALTLPPFFIFLRSRLPKVYYGLAPILLIVCFVHYRVMLGFDTCYGWGELNWYHYNENLVHAFFGEKDLKP